MIDPGPARSLITWAREERVFPAAAVEVGTRRGCLWAEAFGTLSYDAGASPTTIETVFDLASLTKVIATTTILARLVDRGRIDLEAPVHGLIEEWRQGARLSDTERERLSVTVRDLLEHSSGLPGWAPLFHECRGREQFCAAISRTPLAYTPRTRSVYSDLGFMLLGILIERLEERPLDAALAEALSSARVPAEIGFLPPQRWHARIAPTRRADERGLLKPGEVDDTNAWAIGGVAGHAGLFGTAPAVGSFARAVLRTLHGDSEEPLLCRPSTMHRFLLPSPVPGSSRALGWDLMRPTSSCGTRLSPASFGHTGFTGTSLWIDPERDIYAVLLCNRVHPEPTGVDAMREVRRAFHDAVIAGLEG